MEQLAIPALPTEPRAPRQDTPTPRADPRVLVVEDMPEVAVTLQRFLERSGMRTVWAQTGARAIELTRSFAPDVVLLDLELPDTNGVSLITWLRTQRVGIIVVSGHGEEAERVVGLELGADDYIAKPPALRELVARIRAVHRRAAGDAAARLAVQPSAFRCGPWQVDLVRRQVSDTEGAPVAVTAAEFTVLQMLAEARGCPVSRERLSEAALRRPWRPEDRSIDQLVFSLRRKLNDADRARRLIQSVRGAGYVLVAEPGAE